MGSEKGASLALWPSSRSSLLFFSLRISARRPFLLLYQVADEDEKDHGCKIILEKVRNELLCVELVRKQFIPLHILILVAQTENRNFCLEWGKGSEEKQRQYVVHTSASTYIHTCV